MEDEAPPLPDVEAGAVPEGSVGGMGDINLYPKRVTMDARSRIASIGLYNRTIDPGEYEISVVDMVMTPEGDVYPVDNLPPGVSTERLRPASGFLRWSPRRVRLLGSEAQTVRIMARPSADLPDGEYRAHFMAVSVPQDVDQGLTIDDAVGGADGSAPDIGVLIRPRFGISIPIIVRVGETTLDVGLERLGFVDTPEGRAIGMTITRQGSRSAFGDITVTAAGSSEPVAIARGIGVYPEIDSREVILGLSPQFDTTLLRPGTVLTVTYTDDDFAPGETLASSSFVVP
ncbi:hypothetical protein AAW00_07715 [Aurantiacibacter luteus]|uniref:Pili assembly chaperone N-terminal domain-containing protein n=1 Tax=Aurantiacibacter luteus TaxID=1581420 RepID=A0A0G9MZW5_9SPHN|nr:hypothetical protein AAW00_07715 [Aurantiacibacter luteus]